MTTVTFLFIFQSVRRSVRCAGGCEGRGGGGASDLAVTLLGFPDVKKFLEDYIHTYYTAYTHTLARKVALRRSDSLFFPPRADFSDILTAASRRLSASEPSKLNK